MKTFAALLSLCEGEFTGHRSIPLTKASDAELWYFHWTGPEQTATIETPVILHAIAHYDVIVMANTVCGTNLIILVTHASNDIAEFSNQKQDIWHRRMALWNPVNIGLGNCFLTASSHAPKPRLSYHE